MNVEPSSLVFRSVALNQAYTASLSISNPLTAPVEFTLRASNPRYTLSPNKVTLVPNQQVIITVRLLLNHYPNKAKGKQGQEDTIHIKSPYFEQMVNVVFFLVEQTGASIGALEGTHIQRSASPGAIRASTSGEVHAHANKTTDTMVELQHQLDAKDQKIEHLQTIIKELESPYPDIREVIKNHVQQENDIFEEKSEKALRILQAKDTALSEARAKLQEQSEIIAQLQQMKNIGGNAQYAGGDKKAQQQKTISANPLDSHDYAKLTAQRDRITVLEQALHECRSKLKEEQKARAQEKEHWQELQIKVKHLEHESKVNHSAQEKEVKGLRERTMDQLEQIEVLVSEISNLREERDDTIAENENQHHQEVNRLQSDLSRGQKIIKDMEYQMTVLQRTINHDAKLMNGEESVVQKLQHENRKLQNRVEHLAKEQEQLDHIRMEKDFLHKQLEDSRDSERDVRQQLHLANELVRNKEDECVSARTDVLHIQNERDDLQSVLEGKNIHLKSAVEKSAVALTRSKMVDAHVWWAYVWHELGKTKAHSDLLLKNNRNKVPVLTAMNMNTQNFQSHAHFLTDNNKGGQGQGLFLDENSAQHLYNKDFTLQNNSINDFGPGEVLLQLEPGQEPLSVDDVLVLVSTLKESIRKQAVELAHLRQETLGHEFNHRQSIESAKEDLKAAQLENIRLGSINRRQSEEKELKLQEMAKTIRDLSSRSDMHAQYVAQRSDLEAERTMSLHLRGDLESYRRMLSTEQETVKDMREEKAGLQNTVDSMHVLRTVMDIPGVTPGVVIEVMGGEITTLQDELAKNKSSLALVQSQVQALKRAASHSSAGKLNESTSSPESLSRGQPRTSKNDKSPASTDSNEDLPFQVVIDGDATPQKLLDSLDTLALAQQLKVKEETIAELRAYNANLTIELNTAEASKNQALGDEIDSFEKHGRSELEASLRRQELMSVGLQEVKDENNELRTMFLSLQKENVELQRATNLRQDTDGSTGFGVSDDEVVNSLLTYKYGSLTGKTGGKYSSTENEDAVRSSTDSISIDELTHEVERLQTELDDRESQLRNATDSLQALDTDFESGANLSSVTDTTTKSRSRKLVKRVVELTAELNAQRSSASLKDQSVLRLEHDIRHRGSDVNKLRAGMKRGEEAHSKLHLQLKDLNEKLRDSEQRRLEDCAAVEIRNRELSDGLREVEARLVGTNITIDELRTQAHLFEQDNIESWLQTVLYADDYSHSAEESRASPSAPSTSSSASENDNAEEGISGRVNTLLQQWWEDSQSRHSNGSSSGNMNAHMRNTVQLVGTPMSRAGLTGVNQTLGDNAGQGQGSGLSKPDQLFLQRVADLVTHANHTAQTAQEANDRADTKRSVAETHSQLAGDRLRSCLLYLNRCRRRVFALEKIVGTDTRAHFSQHEKSVALLKKSLEQLRTQYSDVRKTLSKERRENRLAELQRKFESKKVQVLQARLGSLEGKGSSTVRAKQEVAAAFETRLSDAEQNMQDWFRKQLPQLLTGFAIPTPAASTSTEEQEEVKEQGIYALSSALCAEKALVTKLQLDLKSADDRSSWLDDQLMSLRGVLMKWKAEVDNAYAYSTGSEAPFPSSPAEKAGDSKESSPSASPNSATSNMPTLNSVVTAAAAAEEEQIDAVLTAAAEAESRLATNVQKLTKELLAEKEQVQDLSGRLTHIEARNEEMKNLVELSTKEEQAFKSTATKQLARMQLKFDLTSAEEFKKMKRLYEDEKRKLRGELERVLGVVDFASKALMEEADKERKQFVQYEEAVKKALEEEEARVPIVDTSVDQSGTSNSNNDSGIKGEGLETNANEADDKAMDTPARVLTHTTGTARLDALRAMRALPRQGFIGSALNVKDDILSQRGGETVLRSILDAEHPNNKNARMQLSSDGQHVLSPEGKPLMFPDLSDVVGSRIRSLLTRLAEGPDLERKMKQMRIYPGRERPADSSFAVSGEEGDSVDGADSVNTPSHTRGGHEDADVSQASARLEEDLRSLQKSLDQERARGESLRGEYDSKMQDLEKSFTDRLKDSERKAQVDRQAQEEAHARAAHSSTSTHYPLGAHHAAHGAHPHSAYAPPHHVGAPAHNHSHAKPHYMMDTQDSASRKMAHHAPVPEDAHFFDGIKDKHAHSGMEHHPGFNSSGAAHDAGLPMPHPPHHASHHHSNAPTSSQLLHAHEQHDAVNLRMSYERAAEHAEEQKKLARHNEAEVRETQEKFDKQFALLEDLQTKLKEVSTQREKDRKEIETARRTWDNEKVSLDKAVEAGKTLIEELRTAHESAVEAMKKQYEVVLHNAQTALEDQLEASGSQVSRLEDLLNQSQRQVDKEKNLAQSHAKSQKMLETQVADMQRDQEDALGMLLAQKEQGQSDAVKIDELTQVVNSLKEAKEGLERELEEVKKANDGDRTLNTSMEGYLGGMVNNMGVPAPNVRSPPRRRGEGQVGPEFVGMQILLEKTTDQLEEARTELRLMEERYEAELNSLRHQCKSLNRDKGELRQSLNASIINELPFVTLEAEEQIRKLEYQLKSQSIELEAIRQSQNHGSTAKSQSGITEQDLTGSAPINVGAEIDRARLAAAEDEIETLQVLLSKQRCERRAAQAHLTEVQKEHAEHKVQLSDALKAADQASTAASANAFRAASDARRHDSNRNSRNQSNQGVVITPGGSRRKASSLSPSPSRTRFATGTGSFRTTASPARGSKRQPSIPESPAAEANAAASELRQALEAENSALKLANNEISLLKESLNEVQATLKDLKGDLKRKTKLLEAARIAKSTEESAAESWKGEFKTLEENHKRLSRAVSNKDILIKDLKSKLEEHKARDARTGTSTGAGPTPTASSSGAKAGDRKDGAPLSSDLVNLSHSELRTRLRVSEQERVKIRSRLNHVHDRLLETEAELRKVKDETSAASKVTDKIESLRFTLARREAQVRSLKIQMQTVKTEAEDAMQSYSKSSKEGRAQYEALRQSFTELANQSMGVSPAHSPAREKRGAERRGRSPQKGQVATDSAASKASLSSAHYIKSTKSSHEKKKPPMRSLSRGRDDKEGATKSQEKEKEKKKEKGSSHSSAVFSTPSASAAKGNSNEDSMEYSEEEEPDSLDSIDVDQEQEQEEEEEEVDSSATSSSGSSPSSVAIPNTLADNQDLTDILAALGGKL